MRIRITRIDNSKEPSKGVGLIQFMVVQKQTIEERVTDLEMEIEGLLGFVRWPP